MAHAQECDSCTTLFKPVKGTVSLEYQICEGRNSYQGYSADDHDDRFSLCPKCSAAFLAFIKHDGNRGDGTRGAVLPLEDRDRRLAILLDELADNAQTMKSPPPAWYALRQAASMFRDGDVRAELAEAERVTELPVELPQSEAK